jgi:hypothetical protein
LDVGAGDLVKVVSDVVSVESTTLLEAQSDTIAVTAEQLDVFTEGGTSLKAGELTVDSFSTMDVASGGLFDVKAEAITVQTPGTLDASAQVLTRSKPLDSSTNTARSECLSILNNTSFSPRRTWRCASATRSRRTRAAPSR